MTTRTKTEFYRTGTISRTRRTAAQMMRLEEQIIEVAKIAEDSERLYLESLAKRAARRGT
jgi:hypothetical protein